MATFLGHPVHSVCRNLISFHGAISKEECFGTRLANLHYSKLSKFPKEISAGSLVISTEFISASILMDDI